jgi:hypothetical protein
MSAGDTTLIAHLGDPTGGSEASMIGDPCFERGAGASGHRARAANSGRSAA